MRACTLCERYLGIGALCWNCRSMLHAMTGICRPDGEDGTWFGCPSERRTSTRSCRADSQRFGSPSRMIAACNIDNNISIDFPRYSTHDYYYSSDTKQYLVALPTFPVSHQAIPCPMTLGHIVRMGPIIYYFYTHQDSTTKGDKKRSRLPRKL